MDSSSYRTRSSSPLSYRKSSSFSSTSSTSSFMSSKPTHHVSLSSASSYFNSGSEYGSRSMSDSVHYGLQSYNARTPVAYPSEEMIGEPLDTPSGDSISVSIRFRPLNEREFLRGDEIAWYADDDKIVRNEYNPATAYAFDKVFGPHATSQEVYEVAARPVVKAAMEGVNGTVFAYGVTSSGKTHTMHGDQNSPGIIPLAIKDVFSIIQDTPGREFLLRVSYIEIYNEVINDLLDPTGQNLRVREDAQGTYIEGIKEEVVLSPGHALSFIASGEEHRHVGSNNFNLFSSRSHTIFTLMIESSAHGDEYDGVVFSQLVICTVTPASSNMEETHNTLKFASRAKRVEIYASRNKIIDEKSLIKKYQREISVLKEELDHLRKGTVVGINHEELLSLRQQLEEGQVKMQSRLEEEEEAKAALMSRIQRLTKLILVSTKSTIPGGLSDLPSHQRRHSVGEEDKLDLRVGDALLMEDDNKKDSPSLISAPVTDPCYEFKNRRSFSRRNDEFSPSSRTFTESTKVGELISWSKLPAGRMTSDQMDLLVEQVKMLAGEIAFSTSTLKRLVDQSVNDPDSSKTQIQNLEREIQEKKRQMRVLEQRITESEASISKASFVDMQQKLMKFMTECNEKSFELEIKSADNRILQEQLQNKCYEIEELQGKVNLLEQPLASLSSDKISLSSKQGISEEYVDELRKKVQSQEIENEKLKLEQVQLSEENSGLHVQNQKLAEEASYAKELASAAAVELKSLAGEVTKLSMQNAKQEKELLAARELAHSRGFGNPALNGVNRKYNASMRPGHKGRLSGRSYDFSGVASADFESWDLDPHDLKMELQARKQQEAALKAALAEKELVEDEYRKKVEEAKKREEALENDLANMWVLVAKLKKGAATLDGNIDEQRSSGADNVEVQKANNIESNNILKERQASEVSLKPANERPKEEPLVVRLKARMQEMKEKELKSLGNGDANSYPL
ncbi:Detected protein of confused Function [Hibiscus syriacus]|uniref:Detected protein of confused Function n=1 Tax=Hibiscus syriacus TaxID=106335 RepID=A0A6A2Y6F9_HIBSY|nr:Detected protein of confused Function [Hibiscus syriacus]